MIVRKMLHQSPLNDINQLIILKTDKELSIYLYFPTRTGLQHNSGVDQRKFVFTEISQKIN